VLRNANLEVEPGAYVSILGQSGAGKTTLLALIGGLASVVSGSIMIDGKDLSVMNRDALADYRRNTIGFVFQNYCLLDHLTALENVALPLVLSRISRQERHTRAQALLDEVGLAHCTDDRPGELSGGERQRVAIARAIANRPRLLLADEPTGNLDEQSAERVLSVLEQLRADYGCTLVVVTHQKTVAARADLRGRIREGVLEHT
jgi:ABC-type lipoprotein export system ATPase subunit